MRKVVAMVALALMAGAGSSQTARAAESSFAGVTMFPPAPGPTVRTATINPRTGTPTSAVTRLQPVIGSVQRTSHFSNPFTQIRGGKIHSGNGDCDDSGSDGLANPFHNL